MMKDEEERKSSQDERLSLFKNSITKPFSYNDHMMYILIDNYVFDYSCMSGQIGLKVESGTFETSNVLLTKSWAGIRLLEPFAQTARMGLNPTILS